MLSPRVVLLLACLSLFPAALASQSWPLAKVERSLGLLTVAEGSGNCTAFSIHEAEGRWLTAKHCTVEGKRHLINGIAAVVIYRDPSDDIVVLKGPQAPALRFASPPQPGSPLAIIGFPSGLALTGVSPGVLSSLATVFTMDEDRRTHVSVTGTSGVGGMSGSPIVTPKGEFVSVHTFSICRTDQPTCYVAAGVSYQTVRRLARMFAE